MRNRRCVIFFAALIVVVALFAALGYRYWYQPTFDFLAGRCHGDRLARPCSRPG